jgi:hypothetical protein
MKIPLAALIATTLALSGTAVASADSGGGKAGSAVSAPDASSGVVIDWNSALLRAAGTAGAQPATIHPTRSFAIASAAMYDAVVATTHRGSPYLFSLNAPRSARPDAAAAQAGHDTLVALYPTLKSSFDAQLTGELAALPNDAGEQQGIEVGRLSAQTMLAARAEDGSAAQPRPPVSKLPGDYQLTPPNFAPAAFTQWPAVSPFVLNSANQIEPQAPPRLNSADYAKAVNEVKSLGQNTSSARSADQTVTARFWQGPIWISWNEIAENAARTHHTDINRTAQLFAVLNLSLADTTIAFYQAKYSYDLWRPVTAIREADAATSPGTQGDPQWSPLVSPTAPDPSYPGAHSSISGAGATVLTDFFGGHDRFTATSDVMPGVTRSFASYNAAATEAGLSRIYAGQHTRLDHDSGLRLGHNVAAFVLRDSTSPQFGTLNGA